MARFNSVTLLGRVVKMEPKMVGKDKTDGKNRAVVMNFQIQCFDKDDNRYYRLPVAYWGIDEVDQCEDHMNVGDLVLVQGELRYKFIKSKVKDEKTGKTIEKVDRIYTTVKASTVEFLSKKLKNTKHIKDDKLNHSINEVKLIGNLVEHPTHSDKGFVVAIDRLYPTKEVKGDNNEKTDFVTLIVDEKEKMSKKLKKGSVVIVDGKLMTRKKIKDKVIPTIVVDVKNIVGR